MQQLSGLDTAFIQQESNRTPMHISPVLIYDPSTATGGQVTFEQIKQVFADNINASPVFTRKLHNPFMGMDEPYWIDDPDFRLDHHLHETAVPAPGDWQQTRKLLTRLHSYGLDMQRPLWEAHFIHGLDRIDGLPEGCVALMLKIHHAAIDGVALARIIHALHREPVAIDDDPEQAQQALEEDDTTPDYLSLISRANVRSLTRSLKLTDTAMRVIPAIKKLHDSRQSRAGSIPSTTTEKTRFNGKVSQRRCAGAIHIDMAEFKAIKRQLRGVTPNDIAVSIVGGALRKYLDHYNALPQKSLVCGAPVNLRGKDEKKRRGGAVQGKRQEKQHAKQEGNRIATMRIGMASHIEDPVKRVRAVHEFALAGKEDINTLGTGTIMDISDSFMPGLLSEGLKAISLATRYAGIPVPFHVMVSNVPGSPRPVYLAGAELQLVLGFGPIRDTMGLFHIITHSARWMSISFTSCQDLLPDYMFYEECLEEAYEDLWQATVGKEHDD